MPSQSAWDDETPGPSYSTLLPSSSQSHGEGAEPSSSTDPPLSALDMTDPAASVRESAGPGEDEEEEECLIVGYVKPMAERTPELVQLSSDSSEEEQEPATTETMAAVTKSEASQVQLLLQSHMNPISPNSSPGPASLCSPQNLHSDGVGSHNIEQESNYLSSRGHRSKDGSHRDDSRFRGHKKHRSHRRSGSKEKDKSLEQSRHVKTPDRSPIQSISQSITQSWTQSPAVSIWSGSPASKSHSSDCSPSKNKSGEHSCHVKEKFSHSPSNSRRRRTKERKSRSPDSDSFLGSHHPREAKRCRKRRKRSVSSSSADSHSERSCLDKPSGKRKYKTRHLERVAQRQHKEGTASKEKRRRSRERSPSVEIIYEQRPPDPYQRRKRRHRKRRKELRSPTVITIDSDSDRTIDCLDRVMDVIDQTSTDVEQRDRTPEQNSIQNPSFTLDSSNPLSEPSSPMGRVYPTTERTLNLDDCVVDVVNHSSSDCSRNMGASNHEEFIPDPLPVDSIITAPPSDVRLLETILQDLVDFLPRAEREMGPSSPGQQEPTSSQQKDQSEMPKT